MFVPVGDTYVNVLNVSFIRADIAKREVSETDSTGNVSKSTQEIPVVDIFVLPGDPTIRVENYTVEEVAKILNAGIERYCQMQAMCRHAYDQETQ
jgi:uncharacterized protein involved in propanediol utilization